MNEGIKEPIPIVCFDLTGNFLGEYVSIGKAARSLGLNTKNICKNLTREILRCDKFIFLEKSKYKEGMRITYEGLKKKKDFLTKHKV